MFKIIYHFMYAKWIEGRCRHICLFCKFRKYNDCMHEEYKRRIDKWKRVGHSWSK